MDGSIMARISLFFILFQSGFLISHANPLIGERVRLSENQEFPFIVSLSWVNSQNAKKEEQNHKCGGSLITRRHVLTAAHCVDDVQKYNELVVKVGSVDLRAAQAYEIEWWETYEKWAENEVHYEDNLYHDIAVVKLLKNVSLTINLPELTRIPEIQLYGRTAMTAGWGLIEHDIVPKYQRTAELRVLRFSEALFYKPEGDRTPRPNQVLYTKAEPSVIITCGDSGSPLLINKNEIIGVNVANCFKDASDMLKTQNVHTSINYYLYFVTDVMTK